MKRSPTAAVAARNVQSIFCIYTAAPKEVTANGLWPGRSLIRRVCDDSRMLVLGLHPAHAPSTYGAKFVIVGVHSPDTGDQNRGRT